MTTDIYNSLFLQLSLFILLAFVLIISAVSLFIKPAKRTIRASLVEASTGHILDISQSETSIGRAKTCDIIVSDISVSRFHAVLSKRSTGWMIFDTNSTSGTVVNGKKIEKKMTLNDGDSIKFGGCEYIFYSTAVTTKQQIVPKTKSNSSERQKYKKVSSSATANERLKKGTNNTNNTKKTAKNSNRPRKPKSE